MKQTFIPKTFSVESQGLIQTVNRILGEYAAQGYDLSLRQLYYQLVARDLLPDKWRDERTGSKNNFRAYKNLGNLVSDARLAGLIDWDMIKDRGRETVSPSHWANPGQIVEAAVYSYHEDKWRNQPVHVEVMVEKDALSGVLEPVCRELDIPFTANKGYSSSSAMYEAGRRMARYARAGKEIWMLYLGDHDPSGIDMTRDIDDRLAMFAETNLEVNRLALNFDQVQLWNPPENPAKETDSRSDDYIRQFGTSSWELDAIEPVTLAELVRDAIADLRDDDLWQEALDAEKANKDKLLAFAETFK